MIQNLKIFTATVLSLLILIKMTLAVLDFVPATYTSLHNFDATSASFILVQKEVTCDLAIKTISEKLANRECTTTWVPLELLLSTMESNVLNQEGLRPLFSANTGFVKIL